MSFKYSRYISRVVRHPWCVTVEKFEQLTELMRERANGIKATDEEIADRVGHPSAQAGVMLASMEDGEFLTQPLDAAAGGGRARSGTAIAIVPVHGTIANRADSFEASSGGTSAERISGWMSRLVADDAIGGILLDFDSPGGSVDGVPELASQIAKATAVKPVWAHVNALAASAGYWLASQASQVISAPTGRVGSIGVFMLHVDESEALAKLGVKITGISAGDYKLEGASWEPLDPDTKAFLQREVDAVYRDFLAAVAKGRGVTVAEVKKSYGQGRVFNGKDALAVGMIDRIGTLDETLARMVGTRPSTGRAAAVAVPGPIAGAIVDDVHDEERELIEALETAPGARTEELAAEGVCPDCRGAGLKPERFMSDPQGQETCPTCNGSGKESLKETPESLKETPAVDEPAAAADDTEALLVALGR